MMRSSIGALALSLTLLTSAVSAPRAEPVDAPLPPPATTSSGCGCEQAEPLIESGDYESGKLLLETLVAKGDARAMNGLGYLYESGLGVEIDGRKAFDLYRKSAAAGYVGAEVSLGRAYLYGVGVRRDPMESFRHYKVAAMRGDATGDTFMAYAYQHGYGVPVDFAKAIALYQIGVQGGDDTAMNQVGYLFQHGLGVPQNLQTAFCWYTLALVNGHADAQRHLDELAASGQDAPPMGVCEVLNRPLVMAQVTARN